MKIAMIGTGYVGLVSGVCFSDFGHDIVCVDKDPRKIEMLERGEVPIFEPGLDRLMAKNVEAGRLTFTRDLKAAIAGADAVFIAVGTPTRRGDGHADLTYVMAAAEEIAKAADHYMVIVTKSTVPVGTNRKVAEVVRAANPDLDFDVASNPEFLREGAAIDDFMKPDRVVVGVQTDRAAFMHCLPVRRGVVVDGDVLDGDRAIHLLQVEYRLHAQKAILEWVWGLGAEG